MNYKLKSLLVITLFTLISTNSFSQLPDSCKLEIGTNLSGLADWGTEIPFVDLMHTCRTWYTKSNGDPNDPFNSGFANKLEYRPDGYPTHIPQNTSGTQYTQDVATIWAITDGWTAGKYTVLWEGDGEFEFWGSFENLIKTDNYRMTFDFPEPKGGVLELRITYSNIDNPIHNVRILMPGTENTYQQNPFNQVWLDKISIFETFRFMDWGQTNGWGIEEGDDIKDTTLVDWDGRSKVDYYTWTHSKGIPYEMMIKLMNSYDKDGWVCVPHRASEDYIRKMARLFKENLEENRHIYVEYSNEIWNWIFPQTQWANYHGCEVTGETWPEGTAKFVQRMLNYWTDEFKDELYRTTRVVGVFTGWLDVAQRVAFNIDTNSFDAIAPTYYFHLAEDLESELDNLGPNATIGDVARIARQSMPEAFNSIRDIKHELADVINKPLAFYEGGQHLTPNPFGTQPTYEKALLDIQRDTSMYNMYNEWFDQLRTLQDGDKPLLLMNFAFVKARNAQYGSWGILETMDQDTAKIPAPKYKAVIENMNTNCSDCKKRKLIKVTACKDYSWNGINLTQSGQYIDTIANSNECDSIITLQLIINNTSIENENITACEEYDWRGKTLTSTGIFSDTLISSTGCDSILNLTLTIIHSSSESITITACDEFVWNQNSYTSSGIITDTLENYLGCDSILTLDLTITNIDTSISVNDNILESDETDATFQWFDCTNYTIIQGETNNTYTPISNGSYAVIVTKNNCTDTTSCVNITKISTKDNLLFNNIKIFPNPSNGILNINLGNLKNVTIKVFSSDSRNIYKIENINSSLHEFTLSLKTGLYFMEIRNQKNIKRVKLIIE